MADPPAVSVCMPVYNAETTIRETLQSVWDQSFDDFEVVLVDDASTDNTPEILRENAHPRLRIYRNQVNMRSSATANRCLNLARGRFVKFLDSDDMLAPRCLATMAEVLSENPQVGLVFSRRSLLLDDPDDPGAQEWSRSYDRVHENFERLERINDGQALLRQWISSGLAANWVGEPVTVMVRRDVLTCTGGFNANIRQNFDMDLWVRTMAVADVAFVDEPLAIYRVRRGSITDDNKREDLDWLDRLWTLEGLMALDGIARAMPELPRKWRSARRMALRSLRETLEKRPEQRATKLRDASAYASWRLRHLVDRSARPFGQISPP
jgi:glycosyltransferase involved in cell wall biosynthesis